MWLFKDVKMLSATDKMWRQLTSTEVYRVMLSALSNEEGAE